MEVSMKGSSLRNLTGKFVPGEPMILYIRRGRLVARKLAKPNFPKRQKQAKIAALFSMLSTTWHGLPTEIRDKWIFYANHNKDYRERTFQTGTIIKCKRKTIHNASPFNHFIGLNMLAYSAGFQVPLFIPPLGEPALPPPKITSFTLKNGIATLQLKLMPPPKRKWYCQKMRIFGFISPPPSYQKIVNIVGIVDLTKLEKEKGSTLDKVCFTFDRMIVDSTKGRRKFVFSTMTRGSLRVEIDIIGQYLPGRAPRPSATVFSPIIYLAEATSPIRTFTEDEIQNNTTKLLKKWEKQTTS
jgi:hypothetical protein